MPVDPIQRGIAISPPATLPLAMWAPLLDRLAGAPFLKPVSLSQLVDERSTPDNPNEVGPLTTQSTAAFDPNYAADIQRLSVDVAEHQLDARARGAPYRPISGGACSSRPSPRT